MTTMSKIQTQCERHSDLAIMHQIRIADPHKAIEDVTSKIIYKKKLQL